MIKIILFLILFLSLSCSKPKTVLICGDHVCVNKNEAQQYFEDNLSLEVGIIDNKESKEIDLVELNLSDNQNSEKKIFIFNKNKTQKKLKTLSNKEVKEKKIQLKARKVQKKRKFKEILPSKNIRTKKVIKVNQSANNSLKTNKSVNKSKDLIVDICTLVKDCSIEGISKYLIKKGKQKDFPDINVKE